METLNIMANTIKSPLVLTDSIQGYKVNKPLDQSGEYVDKSMAEALLSALKDFCDLRTAQSNEDFIKAYHKAHEAIKQAEESI